MLVSKHVCMHVRLLICMHVCLPVCVYVCLHVCPYEYEAQNWISGREPILFNPSAAFNTAASDSNAWWSSQTELERNVNNSLVPPVNECSTSLKTAARLFIPMTYLSQLYLATNDWAAVPANHRYPTGKQVHKAGQPAAEEKKQTE